MYHLNDALSFSIDTLSMVRVDSIFPPGLDCIAAVKIGISQGFLHVSDVKKQLQTTVQSLLL